MLTSLLRLPTVSSPHHLHQFLLFLRAHQPQSLPDLNVLSPLSAPLFTHAHFTTSHILQLASLIPSHPVTIPCKAQFLGPFPLSFHLPLDLSTLRLLPKLTVPGLSQIQPTAPLRLCPPQPLSQRFFEFPSLSHSLTLTLSVDCHLAPESSFCLSFILRLYFSFLQISCPRSLSFPPIFLAQTFSPS